MTPGGPTSGLRILATLILVTVLTVDSSARGEAIGQRLLTATALASPALLPVQPPARRV